MNCSEIRATAKWFGQRALRVCLVYEQNLQEGMFYYLNKH